jgi:hypothetical protein
LWIGPADPANDDPLHLLLGQELRERVSRIHRPDAGDQQRCQIPQQSAFELGRDTDKEIDQWPSLT